MEGLDLMFVSRAHEQLLWKSVSPGRNKQNNNATEYAPIQSRRVRRGVIVKEEPLDETIEVFRPPVVGDGEAITDADIAGLDGSGPRYVSEIKGPGQPHLRKRRMVNRSKRSLYLYSGTIRLRSCRLWSTPTTRRRATTTEATDASEYAPQKAGRRGSGSSIGTDSDVDDADRPKRQKKLKPIPEIAKVLSVPTEFIDSAGQTNEDKLAGIDEGSIEKIRKAFSLTQHENTGEDEAKQALRMASKLIAKINITQADLISRETDEEKSKRAGEAIVEIAPNSDHPSNVKKARALVTNKQWQAVLGHAMDNFFDTKEYTVSRRGRKPCGQRHIYGIADNCTAAAYACEMATRMMALLVWIFWTMPRMTLQTKPTSSQASTGSSITPPSLAFPLRLPLPL